MTAPAPPFGPSGDLTIRAGAAIIPVVAINDAGGAPVDLTGLAFFYSIYDSTSGVEVVTKASTRTIAAGTSVALPELTGTATLALRLAHAPYTLRILIGYEVDGGYAEISEGLLQLLAGPTLTLTATSPAAEQALLTVDAGRARLVVTMRGTPGRLGHDGSSAAVLAYDPADPHGPASASVDDFRAWLRGSNADAGAVAGASAGASAGATAAQPFAVAAATARDLAIAARNAADADAAATGQDRIATASDRTAVHGDRLAADADAIATAADRVQTGLDRTSTTASAAAGQASATGAAGSAGSAAANATQTAADRVQTGLDRTATIASAAAAAISATATATDAGSTSTAAASATAAAAIQGVLTTTPAALPYEVTGIAGGIGTGTGGTPGSYMGGSTGGPLGFQWSVTIGADGKIASYTIVNPGIAATNAAPTLALPTGTGLTGATTPTATVGTIPANRRFYAPSADGSTLVPWYNNGGTLAQVAAALGVPLAPLASFNTLAPAAGTTALGNTNCAIVPAPFGIGGTLQYAISPGVDGIVQTFLTTLNGDGTLALVSGSLQPPQRVYAGVPAVFTYPAVVGPAQYLGFYSPQANMLKYTAATGGAAWNCAATILSTTAASTAKALGTNFAWASLGWVVAGGYAGTALLNQALAVQTGFSASAAPVTVATFPMTDGTAAGSANALLIPLEPASLDGTLTDVSVYVGTAGNAYAGVYSRNVDGTYQCVALDPVPHPVTAGQMTIPGLTLPIARGQFYGLHGTFAARYIAGGPGSVYVSAAAPVAGTNLTVSATTATYRIAARITPRAQAEVARALASEAALQGQITALSASTTTVLGQTTDGTSAAGAGYTVFHPQDLNPGDIVDGATLWLSGAITTAQIVLAVRDPATHNYRSLGIGRTVRLAAGQNILSGIGLQVPLGVSNVRVGLYTPLAGGVGPRVTTGSGTMYATAGLPTTASGGTAEGSYASYTPALAWTIKAGTGARLGRLDAAIALQAGVGQLAAADPTGIADAAAALVLARQLHPHPYLPAGSFTAASALFGGQGLWGIGALTVNGVQVPLPSRPGRLDPRIMARAKFGNGQGALIVVGDSGANGQGASADANSAVYMLMRWLNMGVALDEPVFTNFLDTDAFGLAGHGITLSNPTTPTNGNTNGPIGYTLMLQAGQVMTLTGAYERIAVTATGVTGGQLVFACNGTTYATVAVPASGTDQLVDGGATGQTASGTYTITNTGTAAVEITALGRFGVRTGTAPRIVVVRATHSGYGYGQFTATRLASVAAIATAFQGIAGVSGANRHVMFAQVGGVDGVLGAYGTVYAAATGFHGRVIAAGIPAARIIQQTPWNMPLLYTGGATFESEVSAIVDAAVASGVTQIVPVHGRDFMAEGLTVSTTDQHMNDSGARTQLGVWTDWAVGA